jgi:hypothetical protein
MRILVFAHCSKESPSSFLILGLLNGPVFRADDIARSAGYRREFPVDVKAIKDVGCRANPAGGVAIKLREITQNVLVNARFYEGVAVLREGGVREMCRPPEPLSRF